MAQKLGEYLVQKSGKDLTESSILTFNVDHKSAKDLKTFLQVRMAIEELVTWRKLVNSVFVANDMNRNDIQTLCL